MSVKLVKVTYRYDKDDLKNLNSGGIFDISFKIKKGENIGIIGETGSGKSTLIQHLNGLLIPQKGVVFINKIKVNQKSKELIELRKKVGIVFQYPEDQLFEEFVFDDIAFGPKNMGQKKEEIYKNVFYAMKTIGLNFNKYKNRNSHDLSGGEKRKVAIASILSMKPEILILDEPMSGLDAKSKKEMLSFLYKMKKNKKITIFFVSHDMDDIFLITDKVIVMKEGRIISLENTKEIFKKKYFLNSIGLDVPYSVKILNLLKKRGYPVNIMPKEKNKLIKLLIKLFKKD